MDYWELAVIVLGLKNTSLSTKILLMDSVNIKVLCSSCRYKGHFAKFCENFSQGKFQKFPINSNKYQKQNKVNNVEHLEKSPENFFLESISMASTTASN